MKRLIIIFILLSSFQFAALPPLFQSTKELSSILNDKALQQKLGSSETIDSIIRSENGWTIITKNYYLKVDVEYLPQQMPGPAIYKLHFQNAIKTSK